SFHLRRKSLESKREISSSEIGDTRTTTLLESLPAVARSRDAPPAHVQSKFASSQRRSRLQYPGRRFCGSRLRPGLPKRECCRGARAESVESNAWTSGSPAQRRAPAAKRPAAASLDPATCAV